MLCWPKMLAADVLNGASFCLQLCCSPSYGGASCRWPASVPCLLAAPCTLPPTHSTHPPPCPPHTHAQAVIKGLVSREHQLNTQQTLTGDLEARKAALAGLEAGSAKVFGGDVARVRVAWGQVATRAPCNKRTSSMPSNLHSQGIWHAPPSTPLSPTHAHTHMRTGEAHRRAVCGDQPPGAERGRRGQRV